MYLETIRGADLTYLQALARFPSTPTTDAWWTSYTKRMTSSTALLDINSAYRLRILPDGTIDRLFSAVIEANQEDPTRRFFGGLTFLEGLEEDSVRLPGNRAEFESWTGDFPRLRARVIAPPL